MNEVSIKLVTDTSRLDTAINELACVIEDLELSKTKRLERLFNLGDLTNKFFRVESDDSPTPTGELFVRFYPSDFLLMFTAALRAWDLDFLGIKQ